MAYQRKTQDPFYVNCSVKEFKDKLFKVQKEHQKKVMELDYLEDGYMKRYKLIDKDWFVQDAFFFKEIELDKNHWKTAIKNKKVIDGDKKYEALMERHLYNQKLIADKMIEEGKANIIWSTYYANEFIKLDNSSDTKNKINIEINSNKTGKIKVS